MNIINNQGKVDKKIIYYNNLKQIYCIVDDIKVGSWGHLMTYSDKELRWAKTHGYKEVSIEKYKKINFIK